jgi:PAS domain S-box-containing protein
MSRREISRQEAHPEKNSPPMWSAIAVLFLAMAAGGITARLEMGPRYDWLLLVIAIGTTGAVAMRLLADNAAEREAESRYAGDPLKDLLDSAGPMVFAMGLDGRLTYVNPASERMLGYHASELVNLSRIHDLLATGETERLLQEVEKICGLSRSGDSQDQSQSFSDVARALAPSQVPSFETHLKRKGGGLFPVRLQISALRDRSGGAIGLVAVAVALEQADETQDSGMRNNSRERFRDLFENSNEMIATLDLAGKFLYVNPAWKQCFGLDHGMTLEQEPFTVVFAANCRIEAAGLLRRALDGESIDRAQLRNETPDGRLQELELSLHLRRRVGKPMAVQCLLRDVTRQKQREHRVALQLLVTQIVGEDTSPEMAAMRVLEALCVSQGWDIAIKWDVNTEENHLEFGTAWGVPGTESESVIQECMRLKIQPGVGLVGHAWTDARAQWAPDLTTVPQDARVRTAVTNHMVSSWAAPVQVGDQTLAVLEFYSHLRMREDRETVAAVETVAASLGQMLARSKERERAEELSRQQEILLSSVADGICGMDRNGYVRFVNPAASRMLGARPASVIGKQIHQLVHGSAPPDQRCGEDCPLRGAMGQRRSLSGEGTIYRSNGTGFAAEYFLNPILDEGRFSGSVLSFRDISQRYALDRMKDEFVSTVSHELRTPLTSIRGALGLLSSGMLGSINEKAANLLRIALTNSERLVRLINDILDLERTQSGREPLSFRPVQMHEVVRQAIDGVQLVAEAAGVMLIHDKTRAEVTADADRLLQVLTNLLSNSVKFSPPNSAVSVMLRPGASGVTLSVIDQGRGIPADKLEAIFERFQQVDATDSRQKGGSGLGLAICRAIVSQHNGRIWAERNPVRGSTFRVYLPYQPTAAGSEEDGEMHPAPQGAVLVADSEGKTRPLIADQMGRHGYRVVEASTPEQAVAVAHEGVEAILLDTTLEGINGWEILPSLRKENPEATTPVIIASVATSQVGSGGSTKTQRLDVRPPDDTLLADVAKALCDSSELMRVLIVEDDTDFARMIGRVFTMERVVVKVVHSRQAALDEFLAFEPHLLVLDLGLPNGDGFNIVEWLRQREELSRLPLVVYSGRGATPAERGEMMLGPTNFLIRASVEPEQLETLLLTLLRSPHEMEETPAAVPASQNR